MSTELEKVEKKTLEESQEAPTRAARTYVPDVDIWEGPDALALAADMPGVARDSIEIDLRDDVLTIQGTVSLAGYEGLRPLYSEYNVGNYYRRFTLGETIDQSRISARMDDGVLTLTLPKREKAKPRRIALA